METYQSRLELMAYQFVMGSDQLSTSYASEQLPSVRRAQLPKLHQKLRLDKATMVQVTRSQNRAN